MSNGGYKGSTPARETSPEQYPGVWELTEQFQAQADGNWPFQETDCAPRSLRFDGSSAYLSRTPSVAGNRKTWTWSGWVKKTNINTYTSLFSAGNNPWVGIDFISDQLSVVLNAGSGDVGGRSDALFRDLSAWYHIVVAVDTTQATAADRIKIYSNGVQLSFTANAGGLPSQNYDTLVNTATTHRLGADGRVSGGGIRYGDIYLADVHFIDGQALTPDAFTFIDGQGVLQPKRFTGDYSSGPVYSAYLTSSGTFATTSEGPDKAFDGIATDASRAKGSQANILTFDISSFGFTGLFELWSQNTGAEFSIDGGSNWSAIGDDVWTTVSSDISGVSTIQMRPASGAAMKVSAFKSQGQLLIDASVGRNSFHLDFSDTSSDAALGTDASSIGNTWTVNNLTANAIDYASNYSLTGSLYGASYSPDKLFDGSITSPVLLQDSNSTLTYTFDTPIAFNSTFEVYYTNGQSATTMDINGVSQTIDDNYATREWLSASGITSPVTSLSWSGSNGAYGPYVYAVRVDGNILIGSPASETDALRDSPVNGNTANDTGAGGELTGNYATLNPLAEQASGSITLSNGNLTATVGGTRSSFFGTMALEGKTYWEIVFTGGAYVFGMADASMFNTTANTSPNIFIGETSTSWSIGNDGTVYNNGATQGTETSWTNGDVMGWSYDSSNGAIKIYKNGTLNGSYTASTANTYFPAATLISSGASVNVNFGQRAFSHPVSGYKALCTANLPDPTIAGSTAFDAVTYAGNGGTQSITNYNFSPSFVWIKDRTSTGSHVLQDTVRGTDSYLMSNETAAENNSTNYVTSFNADGFSIGNGNRVNNGSRNYVAWAWDAGEATTTIAAGSLTSSLYNQDQRWRDNISSSNGWNISYPVNNIFNGVFDGGGGAANNGNGGSITFTPPASIAVTKLELTCYSEVTLELPDGSTQTIAGVGNSSETVVANIGSGFTFTGSNSIIISRPGGFIYLEKIKINGKELVDDNISLTVPSIASTVRANPSAGFSIVTYSNTSDGSTIGHSLSSNPYFMLIKNRSSTSDWMAWFNGFANNELLNLNNTDGTSTSGSNTFIKGVSSTTFTVGSSSIVNGSNNYIAYCFAPVEGYSAFGSFEGNSSADGPFVYTGFRPRFVMIKASVAPSTTVTGWVMQDSSRGNYNVINAKQLYANRNYQEGLRGAGSATNPQRLDIDFLSNGFKLRDIGNETNANGYTYIYAAFAENPFKTSRAR